jgi:hypothetical protein
MGPGYQMAVVEHQQYDEHLYILAGTFVDQHRVSGPGTYILNRAARRTTPPPRVGAPSSKWCLSDRTETLSHITVPRERPGHSRR